MGALAAQLVLLGALANSAACGTKLVEATVEHTVVVEQTRIVERVLTVPQTVVVEQTRIVERPVEVPRFVAETVVVERTRVVEIERAVVATVTAVPTPAATPVEAFRPPAPGHAPASLVVAAPGVPSVAGLGSAGARVDLMQYVGIGEGLFGVDDAGNVTGKLAASYTVAPDLSKVTIRIATGVVFHGGAGPFTAEDVAFTLNDANLSINEASGHKQSRDYAALFGKARAIDESTVELPFKAYDVRWNAHFLNEQSRGTAFFSNRLFERIGADAMGDSFPVSTGPFRVVEWVPGDRFRVEAVPYRHWFRDPLVRKLTFVQAPDPASRIAMLRSGDADVAVALPLDRIAPLARGGFRVEDLIRLGTVHQVVFAGNYWEERHAVTGAALPRDGYCAADLPWVGCASQPGDLDEARNVRRALALAIDRTRIVDTVLGGFGAHAALEYVDTAAPYFRDRWGIPYDPKQAGGLMADTAWGDGGFDIAIWAGRDDAGREGLNARINEAVASMWAARWPVMRVHVIVSGYAAVRPGLVARTNTVPLGGACSEGTTTVPFDWPHGLTETSLSRGAFGCGVEIPRIAETFLQVSRESDIGRRVTLNEALVDYLVEEMVFAGTVQIPELTVYNPGAISGWPGKPCLFCGQNEYEFIVPAAR